MAAAAAGDAEAAEGVEAAEVADAELAAASAAEAAARRGELAAFARLGCFLTVLTNARRHGRVRRGRPGQFVSAWRSYLSVWVATPARDGRVDLKPNREPPARDPSEEILVAGEYSLRRRSGVASKMRVLS